MKLLKVGVRVVFLYVEEEGICAEKISLVVTEHQISSLRVVGSSLLRKCRNAMQSSGTVIMGMLIWCRSFSYVDFTRRGGRQLFPVLRY